MCLTGIFDSEPKLTVEKDLLIDLESTFLIFDLHPAVCLSVCYYENHDPLRVSRHQLRQALNNLDVCS